MSRGATLSILGLYNQDQTVLDLMQFPEGFTDSQKQNIKDNILVECAELEFLYPNPIVAKNIIGIWSQKELPYWSRIYEASKAEYNPIENYRRNEQESISDGRTEEHSGSDSSTLNGSDTMSRSATDNNLGSWTETLERTGTDTSEAGGSDTQTGSSESTDTQGGADTVTNKITGFDSNDLVVHDSSETEYGHTNRNEAEGTSTQEYGRTDTITHDTTDSTSHESTDNLSHFETGSTNYGKTDTFRHGEKIEHAGNTERNMLAYGNIGVTTSQEMLTQELELAKIIQVAPVILNSFRNRFCLMVY